MIYVFVNPESKSGKGKKIWDSLTPVFREYGVAYEEFLFENAASVKDRLDDILNRTGPGNKAHIMVLGGDGTANELLQNISDFSRVMITIIPTGSSNDFARAMGIPGNPVKALRHVFEKTIHGKMDLGIIKYSDSTNNSCGKRFFIVSSGIGYDAAVCEEVNRSLLKKAFNRIGLGKFIYFCIALKNIAKSYFGGAKIILDGDGDKIFRTERLLFLAGMNNKYEGGGFAFAPYADNSDGLLDFCVVSDVSRLKVLNALPSALSGKHFRHEGVHFYRCRSISVELDMPLWVHTDGESGFKADRIEMMLEKGYVEIVY